jgi:hypothetical protein
MSARRVSIGGSRLLEAGQKCERHSVGTEIAQKAIFAAPGLDPDLAQTFADAGQQIELRAAPSGPVAVAEMLKERINCAANLAILHAIPRIDHIATPGGHIAPEGLGLGYHPAVCGGWRGGSPSIQ